MGFAEDLAAERERIKCRIAELNQSLRQLPEGGLTCRANRKYHKWFRTLENCEQDAAGKIRTRRQYIYIPKAQSELAMNLALREYYTAELEDLKAQDSAMEELADKLMQECRHAEQVLSREGLADLLRPQLEEDTDKYSERIHNWLAEDYPHNPHRQEMLRVPTIGGFNVRSKSEAMIANILLERTIPFRYECRMDFGTRTCYPDFTILHPVSGTIILWEHFGMMSSQDYRAESIAKLNTYLTNGFFPFYNLITTFESEDRPLDISLVNRIVRMMFE